MREFKFFHPGVQITAHQHDIENEGGIGLDQGLNDSNLQILNLHNIGDAGAAYLSQILPMSTLQSLDPDTIVTNDASFRLMAN